MNDMQRVRDLPLEQRLELYNKAMELRQKNFGKAFKIGKKLGINYKVVDHWLRGCKPGRRGVHPPWKIPDLTPSPELSYVLGVYYGDGWITTWKNDRWVGLSANDRDFVEEFSRCLSKVIGRRELYPIQHRGDSYNTRVCNKTLHAFLNKSLEEHKYIIEEFPAPFLRGFFDSEGGVYRVGGPEVQRFGEYYELKAVSTNLLLLQYIRDLLSRRFSLSTHIGAPQKAKPHFVDGRLAIATKDCYRLRTARHDNLQKFNEKIGFTIKRKQEKLARVVLIGR